MIKVCLRLWNPYCISYCTRKKVQLPNIEISTIQEFLGPLLEIKKIEFNQTTNMYDIFLFFDKQSSLAENYDYNKLNTYINTTFNNL